MCDGYYVLEGTTPVPCKDVISWASWCRRSERTVRKTRIGADVLVSTVFLGLDHRFGRQGPPLLFETMIFGGPHDGDMWRSATWEDAEKGHEEVVALIN